MTTTSNPHHGGTLHIPRRRVVRDPLNLSQISMEDKEPSHVNSNPISLTTPTRTSRRSSLVATPTSPSSESLKKQLSDTKSSLVSFVSDMDDESPDLTPLNPEDLFPLHSRIEWSDGEDSMSELGDDINQFDKYGRSYINVFNPIKENGINNENHLILLKDVTVIYALSLCRYLEETGRLLSLLSDKLRINSREISEFPPGLVDVKARWVSETKLTYLTLYVDNNKTQLMVQVAQRDWNVLVTGMIEEAQRQSSSLKNLCGTYFKTKITQALQQQLDELESQLRVLMDNDQRSRLATVANTRAMELENLELEKELETSRLQAQTESMFVAMEDAVEMLGQCQESTDAVVRERFAAIEQLELLKKQAKEDHFQLKLEMVREKEQLCDDYERMLAELTTSRSELMIATNELVAVQSRVDACLVEIDRLKTSEAALQKQVEVEHANVLDVQCEVSRLRAEKDDMTNDVTRMQALLESSQQQRMAIKDANYKALAISSNKRVKTNENEEADLKTLFEDYELSELTLVNERDTVLSQLKQAEDELTQLKSTVSERDVTILTLTASLSVLSQDAENHSLCRRDSKLVTELSPEPQSPALSANTTNSDIGSPEKEELRRLKKEKSQLRLDLLHEKEKFCDEYELLLLEIATNKNELVAVQSRVDACLVEIDRLKNSEAALQKQVEVEHANVLDVQCEVSRLRAEKDDMTNDVTRMQALLESSQQQLMAIKDSNHNAQLSVDNYFLEQSETNQTLRAYEMEFKTAFIDVACIVFELRALMTAETQLKDINGTSIQTLPDLTQNLNNYTAVEQIKQERDLIRQELSNLQILFSDRNMTVLQLEQRLAALNRECDSKLERSLGEQDRLEKELHDKNEDFIKSQSVVIERDATILSLQTALSYLGNSDSDRALYRRDDKLVSASTSCGQLLVVAEPSIAPDQSIHNNSSDNNKDNEDKNKNKNSDNIINNNSIEINNLKNEIVRLESDYNSKCLKYEQYITRLCNERDREKVSGEALVSKSLVERAASVEENTSEKMPDVSKVQYLETLLKHRCDEYDAVVAELARIKDAAVSESRERRLSEKLLESHHHNVLQLSNSLKECNNERQLLQEELQETQLALKNEKRQAAINAKQSKAVETLEMERDDWKSKFEHSESERKSIFEAILSTMSSEDRVAISNASPSTYITVLKNILSQHETKVCQRIEAIETQLYRLSALKHDQLMQALAEIRRLDKLVETLKQGSSISPMDEESIPINTNLRRQLESQKLEGISGLHTKKARYGGSSSLTEDDDEGDRLGDARLQELFNAINRELGAASHNLSHEKRRDVDHPSGVASSMKSPSSPVLTPAHTFSPPSTASVQTKTWESTSDKTLPVRKTSVKAVTEAKAPSSEGFPVKTPPSDAVTEKQPSSSKLIPRSPETMTVIVPASVLPISSAVSRLWLSTADDSLPNPSSDFINMCSSPIIVHPSGTLPPLAGYPCHDSDWPIIIELAWQSLSKRMTFPDCVDIFISPEARLTKDVRTRFRLRQLLRCCCTGQYPQKIDDKASELLNLPCATVASRCLSVNDFHSYVTKFSLMWDDESLATILTVQRQYLRSLPRGLLTDDCVSGLVDAATGATGRGGRAFRKLGTALGTLPSPSRRVFLRLLRLLKRVATLNDTIANDEADTFRKMVKSWAPVLIRGSGDNATAEMIVSTLFQHLDDLLSVVS